MKTTFTDDSIKSILNKLGVSNAEFKNFYPGEPESRQAVHTVYGGANLFKAGLAAKMSQLALRHFNAYAADAQSFARALGLNISDDFAQTIFDRVVAKLEREAIEDFRIDFEDGYGNRPDAEEDETAHTSALEVAKGMEEKSLPPFIGIRIKPLTDELKNRAVRTLDIFVTTLAEATGGKLPENFVVTLPKITHPEQVSALVQLFEELESKTSLSSGSLKMEFMIETTQSILGENGECNLTRLLTAAKGRCISAHLGTYDYTACCNITANYQGMQHSVCDFAKNLMTIAYAGTGITLSDGATTIMPVGPHRQAKDGPALTDAQKNENQAVVNRAWRIAFENNLHSLKNGYFQGWDLNPGQLAVRYAACNYFFLEGLETTSLRLKTFIEQAAKATLVGDVFDDAATGQGLLNYFLRALNCGAITMDEVKATGLTLEEIQSRSFVQILAGRRAA